MIKCVIVDDEPLAIQLLSSYVAKVDGLELLASFSNPLEVLPFVAANKIDLLFLDVQMPELTGVQLAKIIGENIPIVFTTAYPNYAVDGFELNALDYLVKPIPLERFIKTINRVKQNKLKSSKSPASEKMSPIAESIFVKTEYRHQRINIADIFYFKGLGDYVAIHTSEGKVLTLENMKQFEQDLPADKFIRVHKSYIVALEQIEFIEKSRIVIQGEYIPIGATYQKAFWEKVD